MNAEKLAKQLKKELTRNPKKTVALGLVTLVALWFWSPLVWKAVAGKPVKNKPVKKAGNHAAAEAVATSTAGKEMNSVSLAWDELVGQIAADSRMQTARLISSRDPFSVLRAEEEVEGDGVETDEAAAVRSTVASEPSPVDSGLVLQGTLVSSRSRRATISGRVYGIGDAVPASANAVDAVGTGRAVEFQVALIEPNLVVLVRNQRKYELTMARESLQPGDELRLGSAGN